MCMIIFYFHIFIFLHLLRRHLIFIYFPTLRFFLIWRSISVLCRCCFYLIFNLIFLFLIYDVDGLFSSLNCTTFSYFLFNFSVFLSFYLNFMHCTFFFSISYILHFLDGILYLLFCRTFAKKI